MKNVSISFSTDGNIQIVGSHKRHPNRMLILVKSGDLDWIGSSLPLFCRDSNTAWIDGDKAALLFEYEIKGELRSEGGLLKSIRRRLMKAIRIEQRRVDEENKEGHCP